MIGLAFALYLAHTLSGIGKAGIMRSSSLLGSLAVTLLFVSSSAAFAKDKPRITIEVINSEVSQKQYTYTTPGRKGTSETNCNTNGTTNGTINDYGVGPIQTNSTGNANTNCTTTTAAATPPRTYVRSITQEQVSAILPDGRQVTLWCQAGFRRCDDLRPGKYEAEIDGNSLFVFVHELSGKEHKIKYKAVSVQEMNVAPPPQPVSATATQSTPAQTSPTIESAPSAENIATLKEQAVSGDAVAQYNLGISYYNGRGLPQDYAQAAMWFHKAAVQGFDNAQYNLGLMYAGGEGVPQDYAQAASWFRKAAEQGDADAQFKVGVFYYNGWGLPQDYAEAYFWLDLAASGIKGADLDTAVKSRNLSASHLTPAELSREQERARKWFEDHPAKPQ